MTLLVFFPSSSSYTMKIISLVLIFGLLLPGIVGTISCEDGNTIIFNVLDYGAVGDLFVDNSQAFLEAWNDACNTTEGTPKMLIPQYMTFLVYPISFNGPCKAKAIHFEISGTIVAPNSPSIWNGADASQWMAFKGITGLNVQGLGTIDGQGKGWWDQSCRYHTELEGCTTLAPTALKFLSCNQGRIRDIHITDSPQTHILINGCKEFEVDNLVIQSPGDSPNTDGIHIQASQNLSIYDTKIASGDDCISIGDYTSNIEINNIECGPGHGISIGSLGKGGNFVNVENIHVNNSIFTGTTNGARIKTWQIGRGYVQNIIYENLKFMEVKNPIIIDQNYCDVRGGCPPRETTGVHIRNVVFKRMSGTSKTDIAININCSESVPCSNITMHSIQLESAIPGKQTFASCCNAYGEETAVMPSPCLLHSSLFQ